MKIKIVIFVMLIYNIDVVYSDWFNINKIDNKYQEVIKQSINESCIKNIDKYKILIVQGKDVDYYKWKLKNWLNRCKEEENE